MYNRGLHAGPGLRVCEESAVQHQDSETDPGGGHVPAEDVLESSSSQHGSLDPEPQEGLGHIFI